MRQLQFIGSNTFRWASAVAAVFALFMIVLFGFIYWKIDGYLIARSDRMIAQQLNFMAALPRERRAAAISDHLGQDSRGVQYAGLFDPAGNRLAGNLRELPRDFTVDGAAQAARVVPVGGGDPLIRAIGRRLENGDVLVLGRNVDETREISSVVGQALALGRLPASATILRTIYGPR